MRIELHPGQSRAWRSKKRIVAIIAGTGSGKTFFGPIWLGREIANIIKDHPKADFLVVSPTYKMFQRVVLPATKNFFDAVFGGEYRASEFAYHLPSGAKIWFGSADNPYSLEGVHVRACWLDEAGQMKGEVWHTVLRRTNFYRARILITTTPYTFNWLKTEVYDRWLAGDPEIDVIQFTSIENPYYPKEEFERAREILPSHIFSMFYEGKFTLAEGVIYTNWTVLDKMPKEYDTIIYGADFGFNNPTAVLKVGIKDDNIYILDEIYQSHLTNNELINLLKDFVENKNDPIYCDPSEPARIEELCKAGFNAVAGSKNVLEGIDQIQRRKIFISTNCRNTIEEIRNYVWDKKGEEFLDRPRKINDHTMDALRYAVMGFFKKTVPIVAPESIDRVSPWR